ncbi:hypothetical protein HYU40_03500 [Candidatus Woesearchaeota archaeon]|nr:hypothetical protein [Candidatus Woesearchaeota archaeon]
MGSAVSKREAVADFLRSNVKRIALAIAGLLVFSLLFGISVKTTFVIILLIVAASFSTFYFNYFRAPVNFELVKLSTIVAAVSYGLLPGLAVGIASTFFGKVLIGRIDEKLPLSMLTISMIAVAAAIFDAADITTLGITLVVAYNITMFAITQFMGGDLAWNLPYEGTNLLFNVLLFAKVAPVLLQIIR